MIQRKQSVFLLLAFVASVVCLCLPLGSFEPQAMGVGFKMYNLMVMLGTGADYSVCGLFGVLVLSSILSVATIGLYKNRMLQSRLCACNLFLLVAWYIVFGAMTRNVISADTTFHVEFATCLPAVSIILVQMARTAILKDEKRVRDSERIR